MQSTDKKDISMQLLEIINSMLEGEEKIKFDAAFEKTTALLDDPVAAMGVLYALQKHKEQKQNQLNKLDQHVANDERNRFVVLDDWPSGQASSLQGYLTTTYDKLVSVLGKPGDGDGEKVDAEWRILFSDNTFATIYNYKDGYNYNGKDGTPVEQITDWHIGGASDVVVERVNNLLGAVQ
jgi:hypothetical protein